jgi:8-oxo-dGTP pyrophosphatase MutT (NUDIX family)
MTQTTPIVYVTGFAFTPDGDSVLLIKKTKPQWQAGKLNGVGGKVEEFDADLAAAMVREFQEETSIVTTSDQWQHFGQHQRAGSYTLNLFTAVLTYHQMAQLGCPTEEEPEWFQLTSLYDLLHDGVSGTAMYTTMAINHFSRPFFTQTTESS